jgi:hypothetical protein
MKKKPIRLNKFSFFSSFVYFALLVFFPLWTIQNGWEGVTNASRVGRSQ